MPPKLAPKCCECQGTESLLWRSDSEQGQICQECYEQKPAKEAQTNLLDEAGSNNNGNNNSKDVKPPVRQRNSRGTASIKKEESIVDSSSCDVVSAACDSQSCGSFDSAHGCVTSNRPSTVTSIATAATEERHNKNLRKSTRATRFKSKNSSTNAANANANTNAIVKLQSKRNRRNLFKKTPMKMPSLQASTRYKESVFYKGSYMQIGDIVSLVDKEDNVYYAQIRGLLVDDFCEKSAYLSWLIPTQESPDPRERFDAASYLIGYDEDFPRKLNYLEFVMHAPSNYYYDRTQPFPLPDEMDSEHKNGAYIWTRLPGWERQRT